MNDETGSVREIGGLLFDVRPSTSDEVVLLDNMIRRSYERHIQLVPGERWLDVGGYVGGFALRLHQAGCSVLSYEPDPATAVMYRRNHHLNGVEPNLRVQAVALAGGRGFLHRNTYRGNYAGSSLFARWKKPRPTVPVTIVPFARALNVARSSLPGDGLNVKLDCEGAEIEILEKASLTGVGKLVFEYHFGVDPSLPRLRSICRRLESLGFTVTPEHKIPSGEVWLGRRKITMLLSCRRD